MARKIIADIISFLIMALIFYGMMSLAFWSFPCTKPHDRGPHPSDVYIKTWFRPSERMGTGWSHESICHSYPGVNGSGWTRSHAMHLAKSCPDCREIGELVYESDWR